MWRHGRIIDYFFKRRTKRPVLRAKFARRTEVNSDRSDIRMLEPGIPVERYGNGGVTVTVSHLDSVEGLGKGTNLVNLDEDA